ncbi:MAG: hypothetical protein V4443_04845 [Pseudomonadota bacterium]
MKKLIPLCVALACLTQTAQAATIDLTLLTQPEFRAVSEDLGSALSYKAITPAAPLGIIGFDIGVAVNQTELAKSKGYWSRMTGSSMDNLYVPKISIAKGLPLNIDIAAFVSRVPSTSATLYGGELRYAIMEGGIALPAIAVRGSLSKLAGVDQLALNTKGLDISISKGFAMFSPYAGVGQVWVTSTPNSATLHEEKFTQGKIFAGANFNLGLVNLAAEVDKTGAAKSISAKVGFRF